MRRTDWQRWLRHWRNRWGALRHRILAALGLTEPLLLAGGGQHPIHLRTAPEPPVGVAAAETAEIGHPALIELRRRAVEDLFAWLGCDTVPPQVWPILDRVVDPDEALRRFARSLGLGLAELQARREAELRRFQAGVDLLIDLAEVSDQLGSAQRQQVHDFLFAGDHERVRTIIGALQALHSVRQSWDDLRNHRRLRAHQLVIERAEAMAQAPASLEPAAVLPLLALADLLHRATLRLDALALRADRAMSGLRQHWPWAWEGTARLRERAELAREHFRLERRMLDSEQLRPEPLLLELERVVLALERLLEDAQGLAGDDPMGAYGWQEPDPGPMFDVETVAAFTFLGLEPTPFLDRATLDRARRRARARHHPDRFVHAADKARHEALFKQIDAHYELLRRRSIQPGAMA